MKSFINCLRVLQKIILGIFWLIIVVVFIGEASYPEIVHVHSDQVVDITLLKNYGKPTFVNMFLSGCYTVYWTFRIFFVGTVLCVACMYVVDAVILDPSERILGFAAKGLRSIRQFTLKLFRFSTE